MAHKDIISQNKVIQNDECGESSNTNILNMESMVLSAAPVTTPAVSSNLKEPQRHRGKGDNSSSSWKSDHQNDCQGLGAELGLTPSLLDEVLAEKKMALMRSPEVMKFLQSRQAQLAMEKKMTFPSALNTDKTGKS